MKTTIGFVLVSLLYSPASYADTFGTDPSTTFEIEFVEVSGLNPEDMTGNPNPAGSVAYSYRIGKYETSEDMIDKANALGGLGLFHDNRGDNKPATSISWFEAARFVNWLNTSQGFTQAYKFSVQPGEGGYNPNAENQLWQPGDAGYNPDNLYRNRLAKYFLPSVHEWYKAAYYDPTAGIYYDYPTGSDSVPDGIDFAGDTSFDAVFFDGGFSPAPNDITDVGLLSPYGTAGQGGNVGEWEETDFDLVNDSTSSGRGNRGGKWSSFSLNLLSSSRGSSSPTIGSGSIGFRVASIPEPTTCTLALASLCLVIGRRRAC